MEVITSKANEKVKFIKSLNDKKARKMNNVFYLEGIKVVEEVINNVKAIDIMFIAYSKTILEKVKGGVTLIKRLNNTKNINIILLDEKTFKYAVDTVTPQGVVAVIKIKEIDLKSLTKKLTKNVLLLDKIQDSGNLGTIIRSAVAFDIDLIICTKNTADVYSPKVVRSTMSAILKEKIIYLDDEYLNKIIYNFKENGYVVTGLFLNTDKNIKDINFNKKHIFVLGNEANGISDEVEKLCDEKIKIEMTDNIESLNVGIATGIILYEQFKNKNN